MGKVMSIRLVLVALVLVAVVVLASSQEAHAGRSRSPGTSELSKGIKGCKFLGNCDAGRKSGLAKAFKFGRG
ncbi:hypothetical protein E2562_014116 [Oryza meyeriana var. granulata]|uniref:Uncharacterized protein n=1 Tax=Oryza meyeriana var. granulata TaxID=110450 RepID=A0A6G1F875_9ORYZ|nr:hypothetical protein E2562_014116 [Oryza meyeriana var. granulata]